MQLGLLYQISHHLGEDFVHLYLDQVQRFHGILGQVTTELETATKNVHPSPETGKASMIIGKSKYTLVKRSLDKLLVQLEAWQGRFDPSWYLLARISGPILDCALVETRNIQQHQATSASPQSSPLDSLVALRHAMEPESINPAGFQNNLDFNPARLTGAQQIFLPFLTARLVKEPGSDELLIIEAVDISIRVDLQRKTDVQSLARRLQHADPRTFGLLHCEGILLQADQVNGGLSTMEVVYKAQSTTQPPATLRQLLLEEDRPSLSAILKLAKQLVRSVCYVHVFDFVHKSITPENILVFSDGASGIGESYLVGFSQFRNVNFQTNKLGDKAWQRNLYRHPTRQGLCITQAFTMQHDIYSLGVCLLELGVWWSFVSYSYDTGGNAGSPVPAEALGLELTDQHFARAHVAVPVWVQSHLIDLAKRLLPSRMGDLYTEIVLACLTCLDPGNDAFGNEQDMLDQHGIVVGVRFVEKILIKMNEISF
jgi:hypothetical protein